MTAAFSTRISKRPPSLSKRSANAVTEAKFARSRIHSSMFSFPVSFFNSVHDLFSTFQSQNKIKIDAL